MPTIELTPKGMKRFRSGHPWVFRSDIAHIEPSAKPGQVVEILSPQGAFCGQGFYNPHSQITVRLLSYDQEPVDEAFFAARLQAAWKHRLAFADPDSCRVVHAEADFIPGLILDKFGDYLVMQCLCLGLEAFKPALARIAMEITGAKGVYERDDLATRGLEGLKQQRGVLAGTVPDVVVMRENGILLQVDIAQGQKTGYFLDQKENRAAIAPYVKDARVLDCFCHVGAFSLHAAHYGARETIGVDISQDTCGWARRNAELNGFSGICSFICDNAFDRLRAMAHSHERFDTVILDPPAFTKSRSTVAAATRGYKDINLWGMRLTKPGGFLITCSCSQHMLPELFQETVQAAARDAGCLLRQMEFRGQGKDHPVLASMPESHYLKCGIYQVFHKNQR